jgi:RND family efflux transporter MFP subunit
VALNVEEGDRVEEGQVIARLDTELLDADVMRLEASRAAAKAQLAFADARLSRAEELQKQGFASAERFDEALAMRDELVNRIAETDAALHAVQINKAKSSLHAPFSGRIGAQSVEANETITAGQPIMSIIETTAPEFRVGLPLDVAVETLKSAHISIAGREIPATLRQLRPDIDPVTRTRTAIFSLDTQTEMLFGQTAALLMETTVEERGAWVPVDALQSGDGSVWRLLVVQDDRVRHAAVEILHIEGTKAFVRGSFDETSRIVAAGAHRVVPGQTVTVIGAEG